MASGKLEGGQPKRAASNQGQLRREKEYVSKLPSCWALTTSILHLLWGRRQFKPSDILKVSCWALLIWKEQRCLSVHALQAPLPNLFSSSQGIGLEPECAPFLPLVFNPPPGSHLAGVGLRQSSCLCLPSAKTTHEPSHPVVSVWNPAFA